MKQFKKWFGFMMAVLVMILSGGSSYAMAETAPPVPGGGIPSGAGGGGATGPLDNSPMLKLAMASWWLIYDERYSVSLPGASDGNHLGIIKSLVIGSVSDEDVKRLKRMNVSALNRIRERHEEVSGE